MNPNPTPPRFLMSLLSGYICIGVLGFMATPSLAETNLDETVAPKSGDDSITDVAPNPSTPPSSLKNKISAPESPVTPPATETLESDSPLPDATEIPSTDAIGETSVTPDNSTKGPSEQTPANGVGNTLSNPKIQQIIRDNPQILEMLKNNPQLIELLLKNPAPFPK